MICAQQQYDDSTIIFSAHSVPQHDHGPGQYVGHHGNQGAGQVNKLQTFDNSFCFAKNVYQLFQNEK